MDGFRLCEQSFPLCLVVIDFSEVNMRVLYQYFCSIKNQLTSD